MKTLKELKDVRTLSKSEQKTIAGGYLQCDINNPCPEGWCCTGSNTGGYCVKIYTPGLLCYYQE
jgi:hypothetical protein